MERRAWLRKDGQVRYAHEEQNEGTAPIVLRTLARLATFDANAAQGGRG
jgi:hypothetical protein